MRDEALVRIVDAHLDPATRDFNFDQVRGSDTPADSLASLLATPPMMARWRVVVIRDAQGLSAKARELVEATAAEPPAELVLVISCAIPSGSRAKFYSNLQKKAVAVEFTAVAPHDLPGWIIEAAETLHGLTMDAEAAQALATAVGTSLSLAAAELVKLAAYVQDRQILTIADVSAVVGSTSRVDRWKWFELIGERRFGEALRDIPTLLEAGESGVGLIIGMTSQLLRIGLLCAGGESALERELKPYQRWMARKLGPAARRWTTGEVDAALAELLRTDHLLKTAPMSDRQCLEELLLRLDGAAAGRTAA